MKLLSLREYNLILRSLDKYELYMNAKEKQLSEDLQDKLYYNLYNPKDGVAQTKVDVSALYDNKTEKDLSHKLARIARKLRRVTPLAPLTIINLN